MRYFKRIGNVILILISALTIWYLVLKEYDYEITFKANAAPGSIYNQVRSLKQDKKAFKDQNIKILNTVLFTSIQQEVILNKQDVILDWEFRSINDTITKIRVGVVAKENSWKHRLQVLTGSSSIVDSVKVNLIDFRKKLNRYTDTFRVIVEGRSNLPGFEFIAVSAKTKRFRKANEMMRSNAYLHPQLKENAIEKAGFPFVQIDHWNKETDSIQFNFGFPISIKDSVHFDIDVNYGKITPQTALKATYYGNYRNSDEAWFTLLEYAKKHQIEIKEKPLEIFYNNPMRGGNELKWKAEIFIPIKEDNSDK